MYFWYETAEGLWRIHAAFADAASHDSICDCELGRMSREGGGGEVHFQICYRGPGMHRWREISFIVPLAGVRGASAESLVWGLVRHDYANRVPPEEKGILFAIPGGAD